jgi:hypothetical protein
VGSEVERLFVLKSLNKIKFFTELDILASLLRIGKDNEFLVFHEVVDTFLELGELLIDSLDLFVITLSGKLNSGLAEFADVVCFGEEIVYFASIGECGEETNSE